MLLLADNISKSFGPQLLYKNIALQVNKGEKWALVGPNGSGKTTFLRMVLGLEKPDTGTLSIAKDASIGYLEQEQALPTHISALQDVMNSATEIRSLEKTIQKTQVALEQTAHKTKQGAVRESEEMPKQVPKQEALLKTLGEAQHRFEELGGYGLEARAKQIMAGLGFKTSDYEKPSSEFSGGWQMRISLAKLLLRHPDILLLDEPTNHLDLESVAWFEEFLASYTGSVLLVSHDRSFMDACADHIAALENRGLRTYKANYTRYLKMREDNLDQLRAKRAAQEKEIAHMQVFVDKFRYKATKAKAAQERMARIEQIKKELVVLPEKTHTLHFSFPQPKRTQDLVVRATDVAKRYTPAADPVYEDLNFSLYRGERIGLVGPNGAGKSTLLKLIAQKIEPTAGTISLGKGVDVAYYAQRQTEALTLQRTVLQEMGEAATGWTTTEQRRLLGAFLFSADDCEKKIQLLSGGEKARLSLAKMLVHPAPLLCLDEPTNHLDIDSVSVLEEALKAFTGTIVLISHDEALVRAVCNKIVEVRDGHIQEYLGDYDYYLYKQAALQKDTKDSPSVEESPRLSKGERRGPKTKEQKRAEAKARNERHQKTAHLRTRLQEIENLLASKKERYQELMDLLADQDIYAQKEAFEQAMKEYGALSKEIPALEEEWLNLSLELE